MRKFVLGTCLVGVAVALTGCGTTRPPQLIIVPSYSYVQADLAAGIPFEQIDMQSAERPATMPSVATKLPPMPAAPGFETLVFVPSDVPIE